MAVRDDGIQVYLLTLHSVMKSHEHQELQSQSLNINNPPFNVLIHNNSCGYLIAMESLQ